MGANTEKITIRLTPDQVENIDSIMLNQNINSRSQIIRMALENYISENLIDTSSQKVITHLPNNTINRLIDCISAGDLISIENAIQMSIETHLSSIEDYHLTKRKALKEARLEYQNEQANRLKANEALKR